MSSPCNNKCNLSATEGFCTSCGRTLNEITHWSQYSESYRRELRLRAERRLERRMDLIGQNGNDGLHYD